MTQIKISEAKSVQFPMVKHAVEIGWTPLTPEAAKGKRGGDTGMLFRDELTAKRTRDRVRAWKRLPESADTDPSLVEAARYFQELGKQT